MIDQRTAIALVHEAFADDSTRNRVIARLQRCAVTVLAGDVPWSGVVLGGGVDVVDVGEPSCDGQ